MLKRSFSIAILGVVICLLFSTQPAPADPVSATQAKTAVKKWLSRNSRPMDTLMGNQIESIQSFASDNGDVAYYVVYLESSGFVIVSADDMVEPIIAFAPSGYYEASLDNPLGALVMQDVPERLKAAREIKAKQSTTSESQSMMAAANKKWKSLLASVQAFSLSTVSDVRVAPFVLSEWSQSHDASGNYDTYNYYTPDNYVCGCVATAMAQLMRYWQYPTGDVGTDQYYIQVDGGTSYLEPLQGGDGSGGPYVWSEMDLAPNNPDLATRRAIGHLCHDCGVAVNMDYGSGSSSANTLDCASALTDVFGYSNAKKGHNSGNNIPSSNLYAMINPNLHAAYPVILGIYGGSGGHAVVCDGYGYDSSTIYHHINMGWAGSCTAWYNLPTVDDGHYNFTCVRRCVYNVFPSGTGEIIAGRVTDTSGNAVSGATVSVDSISDTTDSAGIYALMHVNSNSDYTVSVTKSGYGFTSQAVTTGTSTDMTTTCGNLWQIDFTGHINYAPTVNSISPSSGNVKADSPCVNTGNPNLGVFTSESKDIDYQGRENGTIDIGADESYAP